MLAKHYVPQLCNAFVFQKQGGKTEVVLHAGMFKFRIDNMTPDGGLVENKSGQSGDKIQLFKYLKYLDSNGGSLTYNFFRSPLNENFGPSSSFASALKEASSRYVVRMNLYDYDWWEDLQ